MAHIAALYTDHRPTQQLHRNDQYQNSFVPDASASSPPPVSTDQVIPVTPPPPPTSTATQPAGGNDSEEENRCWICFGEESDSEGRWVRPCKCSLISHEECLLNWISENQKWVSDHHKGLSLKKVRCPQCKMVYQLQERSSLLLWFMSRVDATLQAAIPYLTVLGLTCSVLITSTTYGAYAVLTICGTEEGERLLGSPQPWGWRVWVGLPLIPGLLIASRIALFDSFMPLVPLLVIGNEPMRGWAEGGALSPAVTLSLLPWLRLAYNGIYSHVLHHLEASWARATASPLTAGDPPHDLAERRDEDLIFRDRKDLGRTVIGALLLPAMSSLVGSFLGSYYLIRAYIPDKFHRNILGGCLFVVAKDVVNLVYKFLRLKQRKSRHIRNYADYRDEVEEDEGAGDNGVEADE